MCAQIYFLIYTRASSVRPSVRVFTCTRHTIYVHLERSARIDRNDAPGTHVIRIVRATSCYSIKEYEIVVEKKGNIF